MAIGDYIRETQGELKHVSWPTRRQAIAYSVLVIFLSLGLALYLGLFDFLFTKGMGYIINNF